MHFWDNFNFKQVPTHWQFLFLLLRSHLMRFHIHCVTYKAKALSGWVGGLHVMSSLNDLVPASMHKDRVGSGSCDSFKPSDIISCWHFHLLSATTYLRTEETLFRALKKFTSLVFFQVIHYQLDVCLYTMSQNLEDITNTDNRVTHDLFPVAKFGGKFSTSSPPNVCTLTVR
jgi:hypothetical protein